MPDNRIRVVRILEYIYDDVDHMDNDMSHWAVPANGTKRYGTRDYIKSAVLPLELFQDVGLISPPVGEVEEGNQKDEPGKEDISQGNHD